MKQLISWSLALFMLFSTGQSWAQGIQFSEGQWADILAKAKKEKKMIFVDAYAVWCGPCKWMAKNSFPDEAVGQHFNANFVNYKFDMEKGEGPEFANTHKVQAYPTLLFFSAEGKLVHKVMGAKDAEALLEDGKAAIDPKKQLYTLQKQYQSKKGLPKKEVKNYLDALMNGGDYAGAQEVAQKQLEEAEEVNWTQEEYFSLIQELFADQSSPIYDKVLAKKANFVKVLGEETVNDYLKTGLEAGMRKIAQEQQQKPYELYKERIKSVLGEKQAASTIALLDLQYYFRTPQRDKYLHVYLNEHCDNAQMLNSYAWSYFEQKEEENLLSMAYSWAKKSVALAPGFANADTEANLAFKLKRYGEAKKAAEKSIALGKENGDDVSETEALLKKIEEKMPKSANGISFTEGSWEEIKALALKENKMIFVDAYAVWCGPCKWLSKTVFTQPQVGQHFDANYISYKLDMEKGEGLEFAEKHGVKAYPTLLFFSADGELLHKSVGAPDAQQLIAESQTALDPNKQLFSLKKRYEKGDRQPEFLRNYILALSAAYENNSEEARTYLDLIKEEDWKQSENFEIISMTEVGYEQKYFDYVLAHKKEFVIQNGAETVEEYLEKGLMTKIHSLGERLNGQGTKDEEYKQLVEQLNTTLSEKSAAYYIATLNNIIYSGTKKEFKYLNILLLDHTDNWAELNEVAWAYYLANSSKKELKAALKWIDKSIALEENYYNLDTKANLLYELGKKKEALATAEKAISFAKSADMETTETEALIEKIKG
ncbi:thioredoxin domain-containing protein [Saprospira sp. CCB-QB6]|uniref:thioredoxin domain-containing protein n=1 Tax=Saprospira sp. CCB-QB6 TaxID=3023936 RepID=UPI002348FEF7|nr:thioredoxin domain-containing protein [Saprospira sp. CCB-QB6]WCL80088.1 thioredoxin domain-containing protein [Saprospira sp. CCB-QB6]